jgi:two-component system copper resistance phosphate regulon response regulator CusR
LSGGIHGDKEIRRMRILVVAANESSLLEYLMQNERRILSHNMIIEHVWDQSFDRITNILDVNTRHLRAKIDDGHIARLIRTVRGSGYMILGAEGQ